MNTYFPPAFQPQTRPHTPLNTYSSLVLGACDRSWCQIGLLEGHSGLWRAANSHTTFNVGVHGTPIEVMHNHPHLLQPASLSKLLQATSCTPMASFDTKKWHHCGHNWVASACNISHKTMHTLPLTFHQIMLLSRWLLSHNKYKLVAVLTT